MMQGYVPGGRELLWHYSRPPPPLEGLSAILLIRLIGARAWEDLLFTAVPYAKFGMVKRDVGGARAAMEKFQYLLGETIYTTLLVAARDQACPARGRELVCFLHDLTGMSLEARNSEGFSALEMAMLCDPRSYLPVAGRRALRDPGLQLFVFATARDQGLFRILIKQPPAAMVGCAPFHDFMTGDTALHLAARRLQLDVVEALVNVFGQDPAATNDAGQRPIDMVGVTLRLMRGDPLRNPALRAKCERIRACLAQRDLAVAMALHPRLGDRSRLGEMLPPDLLGKCVPGCGVGP